MFIYTDYNEKESALDIQLAKGRGREGDRMVVLIVKGTDATYYNKLWTYFNYELHITSPKAA